MTRAGKIKRTERRVVAGFRRAFMRGVREARKRGLPARGVRAQFASGVGWETWHVTDVRNNLREFYTMRVG